jgi:hypothetical protein
MAKKSKQETAAERLAAATANYTGRLHELNRRQIAKLVEKLPAISAVHASLEVVEACVKTGDVIALKTWIRDNHRVYEQAFGPKGILGFISYLKGTHFLSQDQLAGEMAVLEAAAKAEQETADKAAAQLAAEKAEASRIREILANHPAGDE